MQMRELYSGGQKLVCGNIVNLPIDKASTVNTLPRHIKDTQANAIMFK